MLLQKTDKARTELRPGVRTLGLRERSMLLLADGNKSLTDFRPMFDGEGEQMALALLQQGYLEPVRIASTSAPQAQAPSAPMRFTVSATAQAVVARPAAVPQAAAAAPAVAPAASSDSFEGKRSLATTRMFLFDICERMFARRAPALAESFREALRNAKDRESMLAASRDMIAEIERVAGAERADSISERIAMLLPSEAAAA